jgi:hypothetical protein
MLSLTGPPLQTAALDSGAKSNIAFGKLPYNHLATHEPLPVEVALQYNSAPNFLYEYESGAQQWHWKSTARA